VPELALDVQMFARALDSVCALRQGVNMTALREIKLLRELHSPHIVRLLDVFPHKRNLSLVRSCAHLDFSTTRAHFVVKSDLRDNRRVWPVAYGGLWQHRLLKLAVPPPRLAHARAPLCRHNASPGRAGSPCEEPLARRHYDKLTGSQAEA
jgi:hypothetical protein